LKVKFRESFLKDLSNTKNAKLLAKVQKAIENVEDANAPQQIRNFKKLKGSQSYFRIKIGDYRVGLKMEGDTIVFIRFLSRKEIYRFFP
jgi:mRNA interferase RelE/StbE